jgi:hypothetical protein
MLACCKTFGGIASVFGATSRNKAASRLQARVAGKRKLSGCRQKQATNVRFARLTGAKAAIRTCAMAGLSGAPSAAGRG